MQFPEFPKLQGLKHLTVQEVEYREGPNECKIVYSFRANQKVQALLTRYVPLTDGYTNYMRVTTGGMTVVVSCRDYEGTDEGIMRMVTDFTRSFVEAIVTEVNRRNAEQGSKTNDEEAPVPVGSIDHTIYKQDLRFKF